MVNHCQQGCRDGTVVSTPDMYLTGSTPTYGIICFFSRKGSVSSISLSLFVHSFFHSHFPVFLFCNVLAVFSISLVSNSHHWAFNYQCDNSPLSSGTNKLKYMPTTATHHSDKSCTDMSFSLGHPWGGWKCHSDISCNWYLRKPNCLSNSHLSEKQVIIVMKLEERK